MQHITGLCGFVCVALPFVFSAAQAQVKLRVVEHCRGVRVCSAHIYGMCCLAKQIQTQRGQLIIIAVGRQQGISLVPCPHPYSQFVNNLHVK